MSVSQTGFPEALRGKKHGVGVQGIEETLPLDSPHPHLRPPQGSKSCSQGPVWNPVSGVTAFPKLLLTRECFRYYYCCCYYYFLATVESAPGHTLGMTVPEGAPQHLAGLAVGCGGLARLPPPWGWGVRMG